MKSYIDMLDKMRLISIYKKIEHYVLAKKLTGIVGLQKVLQT